MRNPGILFVLATLLSSLSCSSTPKEPSRYLEKSFAAKRDTARHLKALDALCGLAPEKIQKAQKPEKPNEFCVEALKVRSSTGQKEGLSEKASEYCLSGNAEACLLWVQFAGESGDPRLARQTLSTSCESGDPKYCPYATRIEFRLGSNSEAMKRAKKGCSAGISVSCHDLGRLALDQDQFTLASVSFQKACQDEVSEACLDKTLTARMQGKDTQAQLELSCQETRNPLSCDLFEIGNEKKADPRWLANAEALCKKGSARDCFLASLDQYYRPGGKNLAKFRFGSQCARSDGSESCFMRLQIENPLGFRGPQTEELKKLCSSGSKLSCFAVEAQTGEAVPSVSVHKVAPNQLADSCEKEKYPASCEEKAKLAFAEGDTASATHFMEKACELGSEDSCSWIASQLIARKEAAASEKSRARELFGRACLGGSVLGCEKRLELTQTL